MNTACDGQGANLQITYIVSEEKSLHSMTSHHWKIPLFWKLKQIWWARSLAVVHQCNAMDFLKLGQSMPAKDLAETTNRGYF